MNATHTHKQSQVIHHKLYAYSVFKGSVHPKMKFCYYLPERFYSVEHKEDILKNVGNLIALGSIDFHSIIVNTKNTMEDPIGYQLLQNIFLCIPA